jgi:prepilin-type N-terminal cleavage/methylation domain-containing protein
MTRDRRGFTLIELLVVTVLGSLVMAAALQVLVTNQRIYTAQNAQIKGTQSIRAALGVLGGELREISPPGGDLVGMFTDSVHIRAARAISIICHDTAMGIAAFRAFRVFGDSIAVNDSVLVFADNESRKMWDDEWIVTSVTGADYGATCSGVDGQMLRFASTTPFSVDSVSTGAEIRVFTHIVYGLMLRDGEYYVGRRLSGGSWEPMVGPVAASGVSFIYLDETGTVTTTATEVAIIEVTVQTGSDVLDSRSQLVSDSVSVRIHTRN